MFAQEARTRNADPRELRAPTRRCPTATAGSAAEAATPTTAKMLRCPATRTRATGDDDRRTPILIQRQSAGASLRAATCGIGRSARAPGLRAGEQRPSEPRPPRWRSRGVLRVLTHDEHREAAGLPWPPPPAIGPPACLIATSEEGPPLLPNDLAFSSERQGRVRAYHGREEPRAQPAASRHMPTGERTRVAFGCCNGLLDSPTGAFRWWTCTSPRGP